MARTDSRAKSSRFDERLEGIYKTAVDVFFKNGYVGGTTSEITERVGLTQPALYYYVGGKSAFLVLICDRIGSMMQEGMTQAQAMDASPLEKLRYFIQRHVTVITTESKAFGVWVSEARHLPKKELKKVRDQEREYVEALTELIEAAQDDGSLRNTADPWLSARLLLGTMNWTYRWYHKQLEVDHLSESVLELLSPVRPRSRSRR